jgi:hypothetical protein
MPISIAQILLWSSAFILEILVFILALRRRLHLQLPLFSLYLALLVTRAVFIFMVYHSTGYTSHLAFHSYWITQAVLLSGRAAAIAELAWVASRNYPGFRLVLKWVLACIAAILLLRAAFVAVENASRLPSFVLNLERDIELAAAVILVVLLALSGRYQVRLETPQRLIAIGLFVYSLVQVLNNVVSRQWLQSYFHWWAVVRILSFHAALLIWLIALARPLPAPAKMPAQLDVGPLRDFMRGGTKAIHELASRLRRLKKSSER